MDDESPVSFDYSFAFGQSPSNNAVTDAGMDMGRGPVHQAASERRGTVTTENFEHRDSIGNIDAVFDRDFSRNTDSSHVTSIPTDNVGPSSNDALRDYDEIKDEADTAPAWSDLKTKAGKERKRLPLACIACRRKKIKCSGEKPACKHCLKARVPCVYKVTTRKAAPRTDYMAMLDKRLKRMEDRVIRIIPKDDLPDLAATGRSSVRPPLPDATAKEKVVAAGKRSAEEAFDPEIQDLEQRNRSSQFAPQRAALPKAVREHDNQLFTEGSESLPPSHIQEHLAEVFFDCIYGQSYLLLHKPSFMRKLKAGNVPPVLILAVCAVSARFSTHPQVSTGIAFLRGEQWATPARMIAEKRHFEPNITILTTMLILGLHYFGTCEGGLSWSFGGQAMRMGYALQLHKELDHDPLGQTQAKQAAAAGQEAPPIPELTFTDREIRRRTMWACYLMDTFNSSGTERPSFLSEDYLAIQLPINESFFQMEVPGRTEGLDGHVPPKDLQTSLEDAQAEAKTNMGVAAYIVKAVIVWKRIVKYLNLGGKEKDSHPIWDPLSEFASLQRQIAQLKASLPPTLTYNKENLMTHASERLANQFIFLHIVLVQTTLFLHRFAIPSAPNTHRRYPPGTPKAFLATAATTVLDAAALISKYLADSAGHSLTVPFAGYCAYASATVHIWGIFSKNLMMERKSREHLRHNYRFLNRMKRYWGMFHYMVEGVKDTYHAFADAAEKAAAKSKNQSTETALDPNDPVESTMISAQPSAAGSPRGVDDIGAKGDDNENTKAGESEKPTIFQYGDWFNKYPHGVSVAEWESKHLPHRGENQTSTEAVMSQQSELQSVEEFFASLCPPSKADEQSGPGSRNKRTARKRGKSMAEGKSNLSQIPEQAALPHGRKHSQDTAVLSGQHRASQSSQRPQHLDSLTSELDVPMSGVSEVLQSDQGNSAFDMTSLGTGYPATSQFPSVPNPHLQRAQQQSGSAHTSPFEYTSPSNSSNIGGGGPTSTASNQFSFSYTSALPHLDRQMVFSGYAGIDPSTNGSTTALNNPQDLDFWSTNTWGTAIDVDGFSNFNDPFLDASQNNGIASDTRMSGNAGGGTGTGQGLNSAWFMPFNIEPPTSNSFAGFDDFTGFDGADMGLSGGMVGGNVFSTGLSPVVGKGGSISSERDDPNSSMQQTGSDTASQMPSGFQLY